MTWLVVYGCLYILSRKKQAIFYMEICTSCEGLFAFLKPYSSESTPQMYFSQWA